MDNLLGKTYWCSSNLGVSDEGVSISKPYCSLSIGESVSIAIDIQIHLATSDASIQLSDFLCLKNLSSA